MGHLTRTCSQGHCWECALPAEGLAPESPPVCPFCGQRAEGAVEGLLPETVPLPTPTGAFQGEEVPAGTPSTPTPTADGVRVRCPHCHNPIQLTDDRRDEVLCPGCGGSFRLRDARHT